MLTFGFYNSQSGDRKYNALQMSRIFEGIINDGVFASIGDSLMTSKGDGAMVVNVGTGRAWFNNTWNNNDAIIPIELSPAESVLNRIDAIVLEVGDASDVRTNSIKLIKGTPATSPVAPTMLNETGLHQHCLATIYIGAGVSEVTNANITNKVGTPTCPFVSVVGLDALLPQWQDQFEDWFANLQSQMAGDVATNLQNQITTLDLYADSIKTIAEDATKQKLTPATATLYGLSGVNANVDKALVNANPSGVIIWFAKNTPPSGFIHCNGAEISRTTYSSLFSVIGTTFGAGNGSTTFNLPDLRGEFIRGVDGGRGVDVGRVFGSSQQSSSFVENGGQMHDLLGFESEGTINTGLRGRGLTSTTPASGYTRFGLRPRNVSLLPCIKY